MSFDVFISYRHRREPDAKIARQVQAALTGAGLNVYRAERHLAPGRSLPEEIERAIEESTLGLCLVGADWRESDWCPQEAAFIKAYSELFPVRLTADARMVGFFESGNAPELGVHEGYEGVDELVARIQERVRELRERRPRRALFDPFLGYLRNQYTEASKLELGDVASIGLPQPADLLKLASLYTGLQARGGAADGAARRTEPPGEDPDRESGRALRNAPSSILEFLAEYPRLVLVGPAGSGKSTILRFLTLCMAGQVLGGPRIGLGELAARHASEPDVWPHGALLPVRIRLHDLGRYLADGAGSASNQRPTLESYILERVISSPTSLSEKVRSAWLELLPDRGSQRILLLLDGLDELLDWEASLPTVTATIADFADTYPGARIVLTARPYAYQWASERGFGPGRGFAVADIQDFGDEEREVFVDAWCSCLHKSEHRRFADREKSEQRLRKLFSRREIAPLSGSPMLVTMLASLDAQERIGDADGPNEVYATCCDLLVDKWNEVKGLGPDAVDLGMDPERLLRGLSVLAFQLQARQGRGARAREEEVWVALFRGPKSSVWSKDVTAHLSQRSGVLVPDGDGLRFPHPSFQEYLAARFLSARREDRPRIPEMREPEGHLELLRRFREAPAVWREVLEWFARESERDVAALVEVVLERESAGEERHLDSLAAGVALRASARESRRDRSEVATRLAETLDVGGLDVGNRAEAGRILSTLRDPRPGVGVDSAGRPEIEWQPVPAGEFRMGSDESDETAAADEKPARDVHLAGFRISRFPITVRQ